MGRINGTTVFDDSGQRARKFNGTRRPRFSVSEHGVKLQWCSGHQEYMFEHHFSSKSARYCRACKSKYNANDYANRHGRWPPASEEERAK